MLSRRRRLWLRQVALAPLVRRLRPLIRPAAWLWRRALRRTTFIAITGTLGKTTAKELVAAICAGEGRTYATIGNQNNPRLVELNVLRVRPWHRFAVIEVAGAAPGMMRRSAPIVRPDVALFLAMRRTHTTQFSSTVDSSSAAS